jgi:hypothetical protein
MWPPQQLLPCRDQEKAIQRNLWVLKGPSSRRREKTTVHSHLLCSRMIDVIPLVLDETPPDGQQRKGEKEVDSLQIYQNMYR